MAITYLGYKGFEFGAIEWTESVYFGGQSSGEIVTLGGVGGVAADDPKTGLYCYRGGCGSIVCSGPVWKIAIAGTPTSGSIGVWWYPYEHYPLDSSFTSRTSFSFVLTTTGERIEILYDGTSHTWDAYVDEVKVADGAIAVASANEWVHIQFYATFDAVAGTIQTMINGVLDIDFTGVTQPSTSDTLDYIKVRLGARNSMNYIDDIVWGYGGFTDMCRVLSIMPTADTGVDDWTPSVGDSYSCVDEIPESDADYISTTVDAQETELELEDWVGIGKVLLGVRAAMVAVEDYATAEEIELGVDSGGTDDTDTQILTDNLEYHEYFLWENPDTTAPWIDADIDALKVRVESTV